ncbi:hypothetical protein ANN_03084 [Periplaneta americana]|uniref:Uncharacterized protein n=1 Tax=Periplaneta americana TaxID=6978 RepID=A0ABQ8TY80_PERAM|nr:hypothetical protein ANN_03084 [Periplaneta americana]
MNVHFRSFLMSGQSNIGSGGLSDHAWLGTKRFRQYQTERTSGFPAKLLRLGRSIGYRTYRNDVMCMDGESPSSNLQCASCATRVVSVSRHEGVALGAPQKANCVTLYDDDWSNSGLPIGENGKAPISGESGSHVIGHHDLTDVNAIHEVLFLNEMVRHPAGTPSPVNYVPEVFALMKEDLDENLQVILDYLETNYVLEEDVLEGEEHQCFLRTHGIVMVEFF